MHFGSTERNPESEGPMLTEKQMLQLMGRATPDSDPKMELSNAQLKELREKLEENRLTRAEAATVSGLLQEMEIVKQQLRNCHEQMQHLIRLYGTLRNEFNDFKLQRIKELQAWVNGGPTEREDGDHY